MERMGTIVSEGTIRKSLLEYNCRLPEGVHPLGKKSRKLIADGTDFAGWIGQKLFTRWFIDRSMT